MPKVDGAKVDKIFNDMSRYTDYYTAYGGPLVSEACNDLDKKLEDIKSYQDQVREYHLDFDVPSLQRIVIDLSSCIYFTTAKLEQLQLLADMSKISYKNKYNNAYIEKQGMHDAGTKYSVQQLQAYADTEALEDNLVNFIYTRAAASVEAKLDAAREVLKGVSKSLSAAIQSMQTFGVQNKYN